MRQDLRPSPALSPRLRGPLGTLGGLSSVLVIVLGAVYYRSDSPGTFDTWLPRATGTARNTALVIDFGAEPVGAAVLVTILATICLLVRRQRLAVLVVLGGGATVAATTLLKPVIGRTIHGEFLSYPSGHTALATALGLVTGLLIADLLDAGPAGGMLLILAPATLAGAAMAWSQIALVAHYPTDTLGGFATALAIVPATASLIDLAADRMVRTG